MKSIMALAKKIGPADVPVLIAGETGTGKEIVAELIHAHSKRNSKQMVCINCAGLPAELIESELFGSIKGSFTTSIDRVGMFKHADQSTAFLDELSEMPLALQAKLLRFLQDKRVRRVGAIGEETVNVRIIAAINNLPSECVKQNRLREDLFYRIGTVTIVVPPLRDRPHDILPMASAYLRFYSAQFKRQPPMFDADTQKALMNYDWPGNVRQLQNEMNRCALLCGGSVNLKDLNIQQEMTGESDLQDCLNIPISDLTQLERTEARTIIKVLLECRWNKLESSTRLGISRQALYNRIAKLGIKTPANDAQLAERTLLHNASSSPKHAPAPSPAPAPARAHSVVQSNGSFSVVSAERSEGGFLD
jgi:transcriptional regulator with PAS, ATPase and Fis domain